MRLLAAVLLIGSMASAPALAQTPLPFPKPTDPQKPAGQGSTKVAPPQPTGKPVEAAAPSEAALGVPIYPAASFIAAYEAGRGQRYYLYGTSAPFAQIVDYYRSVLKQRGDLVYDEPPIHMFEIGRFREETMAFYPSVTVKDYTWAGGLGYLNPVRGAEPVRFKTVIQIVPAAPGSPR